VRPSKGGPQRVDAAHAFDGAVFGFQRFRQQEPGGGEVRQGESGREECRHGVPVTAQEPGDGRAEDEPQAEGGPDDAIPFARFPAW